MQNLPDTTAAATKWGDIGDWDVSDVTDFSRAFSQDRNKAGAYTSSVLNVKSFIGTAISKWTTTAATSLSSMFYGAHTMNVDLSGWIVSRVTTMEDTFNDCRAFEGVGLNLWTLTSVATMRMTFAGTCEFNVDLGGWDTSNVMDMTSMFSNAVANKGDGLENWDVAKVSAMANMFTNTLAMTSCNKRRIADAWKDLPATNDVKDWAGDTCPVRTSRCARTHCE